MTAARLICKQVAQHPYPILILPVYCSYETDSSVPGISAYLVQYPVPVYCSTAQKQREPYRPLTTTPQQTRQATPITPFDRWDTILVQTLLGHVRRSKASHTAHRTPRWKSGKYAAQYEANMPGSRLKSVDKTTLVGKRLHAASLSACCSSNGGRISPCC